VQKENRFDLSGFQGHGELCVASLILGAVLHFQPWCPALAAGRACENAGVELMFSQM
jgi:hypothetical protein